ncbi:MAG: protein kinase [Kofleriaceae bacterium]
MTPTRLGAYEVLARLASGGMAEIYAARHPSDPEQVVVIKQMLPQFAGKPEYVEMFLDEGRIVSLLRHPNIVRMHDFGFHGEAPYLAMEYLHGVDLRAIMRDGKTRRRLLPLPYTLAIISAACGGLQFAHEARSLEGHPMDIVHRDVSPQNIVVTFDGAVKLIDFGIAKSRNRLHESRAGGLKGKVPYMAPEQIRGTGTDRRTDIYALGVVLYELVTGRRPYMLAKHEQPQAEFSLMMAIVEHRIARPSTLRSDLPPAIERIIMRALSARAAERYQTAEQMKDAIEAAARELQLSTDVRPVAALLRETFGDQVRKWREALVNDDLATEIASVAQLWAGESIDEEEDSISIEADLGAAPMVQSPRPSSRASSSDPGDGSDRLLARTFDDVTVITIEGKIDESFRGAERGAALSGSVILDLSRVARISSFGVREWLELQSSLERRDREVAVYLARCSEPFVAQLGMIRAFVGAGQVVSFLAPYLCGDCGHAFNHPFDCERDAARLGEANPPYVPCPACGQPAQLDDDASYFQSLRQHLGRPIPPPVRAALDKLDLVDQQGGVVDKRVDGQLTRLRFQRPIDRGFRWNRLLDGLEGTVEIDLVEAHLDASALAATAAALRGLGAEVAAVQLFGAPAQLVALVEANPRCEVRTVLVTGRCAACDVSRSVQIGRGDLRALQSGQPITASCRRCDSALVGLRLDAPQPIATSPELTAPRELGMGTGTIPPLTRDGAAPATPSTDPRQTGLAPRKPARPPLVRDLIARVSSSRTLSIAAIGTVVVIGSLAYALVSRGPENRATPAPASSPTSERSSADQIATGVGTGDDATALSQARAHACRALIAAVEAALPPEIQALGDPNASDAEVLAWFTARLGSRIAFKRHDAIRNPDGTLAARYGLSRADLTAAIAFYSARTAAWHATFVEAPPSRPPGVMVAASSNPRWRVGDRVVRIGDRRITGLDALAKVAGGALPSTATVERGGLPLPVAIGGAP